MLNILDTWPRLSPVIVTQEITAATDTITGIGKVKILRAIPTATAGQYKTIAIPDNSDPDEMQVLIRDKRDPVAVGTVGFVAQDMWGTLWWVSSPKSTDLIRFTLQEDLTGTTAAALINSDGDDNDDAITVTAWAANTGTEGAQGIAWKYEFEGDTTYYIVELIGEPTQLVRFTLYTDLPVSGSATAIINSAGDDDGTVIEVSAWAKSRGSAGDRGIAWLQNGTYWVLELSSGIDATAFELTADATYGAPGSTQSIAAIKLLPDGSPGDAITVKTMGRTRGLDGCRGIAIQRGSDFVAVELQQPAAAVSALLYTVCPPSSATIQVTFDEVLTPFPHDFPPAASPFEVDNPLRLYGYSGTLCVLNYRASNNRYYIASVKKEATRILGTVTSDFNSEESCTLIELEGLDGVLPADLVSAEEATVENIHKWTGVDGLKARAEYNWTTQQWELYQIDCDEEQGVPLEETAP